MPQRNKSYLRPGRAGDGSVMRAGCKKLSNETTELFHDVRWVGKEILIVYERGIRTSRKRREGKGRDWGSFLQTFMSTQNTDSVSLRGLAGMRTGGMSIY